jgi:hypothetical protein
MARYHHSAKIERAIHLVRVAMFVLDKNSPKKNNGV